MFGFISLVLRLFCLLGFLSTIKTDLGCILAPFFGLIQITPEGYKFFLVDLNRMRFRKLSFEDRIKNFARLSKYQEMIELMSDEYSKLSGESYEKVVNLMKQEVAIFRRKIENKSKIKRLLSLRKIS